MKAVCEEKSEVTQSDRRPDEPTKSPLCDMSQVSMGDLPALAGPWWTPIFVREVFESVTTRLQTPTQAYKAFFSWGCHYMISARIPGKLQKPMHKRPGHKLGCPQARNG